MEPFGKGYRLSTGREIDANGGILGIGHRDPSVCSEGWDGSVDASYPRDEWMDEDGMPAPFTDEERAEVAAYMIGLWATFGGFYAQRYPSEFNCGTCGLRQMTYSPSDAEALFMKHGRC